VRFQRRLAGIVNEAPVAATENALGRARAETIGHRQRMRGGRPGRGPRGWCVRAWSSPSVRARRRGRVSAPLYRRPPVVGRHVRQGGARKGRTLWGKGAAASRRRTAGPARFPRAPLPRRKALTCVNPLRRKGLVAIRGPPGLVAVGKHARRRRRKPPFPRRLRRPKLFAARGKVVAMWPTAPDALPGGACGARGTGRMAPGSTAGSPASSGSAGAAGTSTERLGPCGSLIACLPFSPAPPPS
jgi:hypothetical protein